MLRSAPRQFHILLKRLQYIAHRFTLVRSAVPRYIGQILDMREFSPWDGKFAKSRWTPSMHA
jgi:hypothetical protein